MNKILTRILITLSIMASLTVVVLPSRSLVFAATPTTSATCTPSNFLGIFVPWYEYLKLSPQNVLAPTLKANTTPVLGPPATVCEVDGGFNLQSLSDIWLVALAIFDDLLRLAGVVAFAFVLYGGIRYITSQGQPENTRAAQSTIINALVGVAIAAVAATAVSFIASSLGG